MTDEMTTKDYVMTGILVVMLILAGVQAVQIEAVEKEVESGLVSTEAPTSSDSSSTKEPRQSSPTMVGGC